MLWVFTWFLMLKTSKLSDEDLILSLSSSEIQSSPFFLVVFGPVIGRVARYTPSSRPKNASKIKANLEFQKSSDDFVFEENFSFFRGAKFGLFRKRGNTHIL